MIDYEKELNPEQLRAVKTTEGPVLILAVAGAGKTRTLVYRVAYLIENGVSPESILLLTFTNKAAGEMKERASKMLDDRCSKIEACTYHSFCVKMLRSFGSRIGITPGFEILSSADQNDAISIVKNELSDKLATGVRGFPKAAVIAGIISMSVNKGITIRKLLDQEDYEKVRPWTSEIIAIAERYKEYKSEHNMLDFDDMLVEFLRLLRTCEDIRAGIDRRYRYIMVDEYQDSNRLQDDILMEIRKDNRNLAVVGDDMQSLYAFRGADVGNILDFPNKMPGCSTITLYTNYRSNQEILDFANEVVKNHATQGIFKEMKGTWKADRLPEVVTAENSYTESEFVLNEISRLLRDGIDDRPVKLSDIAVLERTSMSSNMLEIELAKHRIPFVKYGGLKFMERAYVRDMLALWKVLVNDKDEISWYRVLQLFQGIAKKYAQGITEKAGQIGEDILTMHPYATHKFASELAGFKKVYDSWKKIPYPDILDTTIEWYQKHKEETVDSMKGKTAEEKIMLKAALKDETESLAVFTELAGQYRTLTGFLDSIALEPPGEKEEGEYLTISTIHSAKGLEFPVVFILDCADGIFPRTNPKDEDKDNEELRCMYVAMTRAKTALYIMVPRNGRSGGKYMLYQGSHFLDGAEDTYLDRTVYSGASMYGRSWGA